MIALFSGVIFTYKVSLNDTYKKSSFIKSSFSLVSYINAYSSIDVFENSTLVRLAIWL